MVATLNDVCAMTTSTENASLAVDATSTTSFRKPSKKILSPAHLSAFQRSSTHQELLEFITDLNESIVGKKLSDAGEGTEVCFEFAFIDARTELSADF